MHGITNQFLYAAKKMTAIFQKGEEKVTLTGTGFLLQKDSRFILITNRHVVDPAYSAEEYAEHKLVALSFDSYTEFDDAMMAQDLGCRTIINFNEFAFDSNPENDIACLIEPKIQGSNGTVNATIPYSMLADNDWIAQKLSVCDKIAYPGFPVWYDKKNKTAIFRMGTIASDPRLDYAVNPSKTNANVIVYEGFSSGGASGSPVFATQIGFRTGQGISAPDDFYREVKLIGINAGHFGSKEGHSGISYFYKSSKILDVIDSLL